MNKSEIVTLWDKESADMQSSLKESLLTPTGRGGNLAIRDYVSALAVVSSWKAQNADGLISTIKDKSQMMAEIDRLTGFRLTYFTPCLAYRYDELKPQEQKHLFESRDCVFTHKINGSRMWIIISGDDCKIFSRNYSSVDCSLLEYRKNVLMDLKTSDKVYAIDCEVTFAPGVDITEDLESLGLATNSPLEAMVALLHTYPESAVEIQKRYYDKYHDSLIKFHLIAPLYFNGKNYMGRTLGAGMDVYDECCKYGQELGIPLLPIARCDGDALEKENFLDTLIAQGKEGVVVHFRSGSYCTSENRSKTSYVKIKRTIKSQDGLGDSIDGFITGFKMGGKGTSNEDLISAVEFSIYVMRPDGTTYLHPIAVAPNIPLVMKQQMTWLNSDGCYPTTYIKSDGTEQQVSLNPKFNNICAAISGQALSAKSRRLEHPRIMTWVPDRMPSSCVYTEDWLRSQTTADGVSY